MCSVFNLNIVLQVVQRGLKCLLFNSINVVSKGNQNEKPINGFAALKQFFSLTFSPANSIEYFSLILEKFWKILISKSPSGARFSIAYSFP